MPSRARIAAPAAARSVGAPLAVSATGSAAPGAADPCGVGSRCGGCPLGGAPAGPAGSPPAARPNRLAGGADSSGSPTGRGSGFSGSQVFLVLWETRGTGDSLGSPSRQSPARCRGEGNLRVLRGSPSRQGSARVVAGDISRGWGCALGLCLWPSSSSRASHARGSSGELCGSGGWMQQEVWAWGFLPLGWTGPADAWPVGGAAGQMRARRLARCVLLG